MTTQREGATGGELEGEGERVEEKWKTSRFFLVGNIPAKFRSADLRTVFSQFVEKGYFVCFHYRHRPEQIHQSQGPAGPHGVSTSNTPHPETQSEIFIPSPDAHLLGSESISSSHSGSQNSDKLLTEGVAKTKCCVVAVTDSRQNEGVAGKFVKMYANKNWSTADGGLLRQTVRISELPVDFEGESQQQGSDASTNHAASCSGAIPWAELKLLPELNPPNVMPRGNVGTPLSTFMQLIRSCKLPSHVIRKLQLEFPKSRSKKRYGAVALDYGTEVEKGGEREGQSFPPLDIGSHRRKREEHVGDSSHNKEEDSIPEDDDHDAEEWERYEAFHEDVDKQGRTSERLFEEELEVVWDKGSSGLVFYTDASYWDQQKGDFDEKCSKEDDWDVDMSAYYDHEGGDKDARDMMDMEMERRLRDGRDTETWTSMAGFERHTKGFGSRVLKKSGWREGSGVGASNQGISEPLEAEGQHPHSKKGLGYRGERLDRNIPPAIKRKKATKDVLISTVYDRQAEQEDTVLRTAPSTTLKFRDPGVQFLKGEVLRTPSNAR